MARLVFARRSNRPAHQNQLVLYRPGLAAEAAGQKPLRGAALPRLPPGSPSWRHDFLRTPKLCYEKNKTTYHHECKKSTIDCLFRPYLVTLAKSRFPVTASIIKTTKTPYNAAPSAPN